MQVNNIHQTSFGAKFNLEGHTKDINKKLQKQWTNKAKSIGTDADTITLKLGMPEIEEETSGITANKSLLIKSRRVRMESLINNKKEEKILGYYTSENIDIPQRMIDRISAYLDKLAQRKK